MVECYDVEHHPNFDAELESVSGDIQKGDEFVRMTIWAISRDPYQGYQFDKNTWIYQLANTNVLIYYSIDDRNPNNKKVCLLSIKKF